MPTIASLVRILPSQVQQELGERLQGGKSEKSTAAVHVELGHNMLAVSVAVTSSDAKSVGEGKKSFLTVVTNFFGSIRDAFIKFFNNVSTKSTNEAALAAAIAQNRAIIAIFHEQPELLKTKGIMRISAAKTELDTLSGGNKSLQDATAIELAALFKKNIREHLAPGDMKAIEQLFMTYQTDQQLPALSQLPEMAQDAIALAKDIAKFKDDNMMGASNLAIVIAPNMMSDKLLMTGKRMEFDTFIDKIIQQE